MKKILLPAMLALLLFTSGCEQPPPENPPEPPPTKPEVLKPAQKPEIAHVDPKPETKPEPTTEKSTPTEKSSPVTTEKLEKSMSVKIYYPDDSGMRLVEVEREVLVNETTDKYTAAVEALLDAPEDENLTAIFPKNASIHSVKVENGMATVDLDGKTLKNFVGGSTGEEFLVGSVVDTLTNFPEVKKVKFLVDGQEIETLSGHMDLSMPLERMDSLTE